jgi:hypothetical protein
MHRLNRPELFPTPCPGNFHAGEPTNLVQGEGLAFKGRRRCMFGRLEAKETYVQEG